MDDSRSARAALGVTLARSAGEIARRWFDTSALTVEAKQDGSPVTQADREIEQHIRDAVAQHFPTDSFLGEEFEETIGTSQYRWIVDPIDGTKSFVHGVPLYANLIALQEKEEIVFGVINIPNADILMHAERGKGCWKNGTRVHVSDRTELDGAYVMATWLEDWHPDVIVDLHAAGAVLRTWGDAYGYMMAKPRRSSTTPRRHTTSLPCRSSSRKPAARSPRSTVREISIAATELRPTAQFTTRFSK